MGSDVEFGTPPQKKEKRKKKWSYPPYNYCDLPNLTKMWEPNECVIIRINSACESISHST